MKKIAGIFLATEPRQPLIGLVGPAVPAELQLVCRTFVQLQDARHIADDDLCSSINLGDARTYYYSTLEAVKAWNSIKNTSEANIFILSLLMWKNWEDKERRP